VTQAFASLCCVSGEKHRSSTNTRVSLTFPLHARPKQGSLKLTAHLPPGAKTAHRTASPDIREPVPPAAGADVISLAGANPAAAALDVEGLREAAAHAAKTSLTTGTLGEYGDSDGYLPLRELIAERLAGTGIRLDTPQLAMTAGTQQAFDLVARVLVKPGDCVAVESPGYPGALHAFRFHGADVVPVSSDDEGVKPDALEAILARQRPVLLHLMPNFTDPTGRVMSLRRRKQVLALARAHRCFIVEDDPFGELYFHESPPLSMFALANDEERQWVIHVSSFSKILAPALRLAWLSAPQAFLRQMAGARQPGDIHTATLTQLVAFHYLNSGALEPALSRMRRYYHGQALAMQRAIKAELADVPFVAAPPQGGMFYWADVPGIDTETLLETAVRHGVAYVPGAVFYAGTPEHSRLRLSFAGVSAEQIGEGIRRLAQRIRSARADGKARIAGVR